MNDIQRVVDGARFLPKHGLGIIPYYIVALLLSGYIYRECREGAWLDRAIGVAVAALFALGAPALFVWALYKIGEMPT